MNKIKRFYSEEVAERVLEKVRQTWPEAFIYHLEGIEKAILLQQESDQDYPQNKDLFLAINDTAIPRHAIQTEKCADWSTYAYVSDRNILFSDYPTVSIFIHKEEWYGLEFKCMLLDDADRTAFSETDTEQGYNLLLMHPITKVVFWGYSHDFDFV